VSPVCFFLILQDVKDVTEVILTLKGIQHEVRAVLSAERPKCMWALPQR